jgi:hypothetical protein
MSCLVKLCHLFSSPRSILVFSSQPSVWGGGQAGFLDTFIFLLFCSGAFRLLCCIAFCLQKEAKMHWQLIFGPFFLSIYLRVVSEKAGNCVFAGSSCPI